MFLETHSHNKMAAFCSSTDYANSQNDAVQLVFGKFLSDQIEMYNWITVSQKLQEGFGPNDLEKFVEFPPYTVNATEKKLNFDFEVLEGVDETILKEWDKQVIKPKPIVHQPSTNYGYGYGTTIWANPNSGRSNWAPKHNSTVSTYKSTPTKIEDAAESAIVTLIILYGQELQYEIETLVGIYKAGILNSTYLRDTEQEIEAQIVELVSEAMDNLF